MRNRTALNESFDKSTEQKVWEKGTIVPGNDSAVWRKDTCGAWIKRDMYGDSSSSLSYGWEIDHKKPVSKGGGDELNNLQPLQWENNRHKGDDFPNWHCKVTSSNNKNIYK